MARKTPDGTNMAWLAASSPRARSHEAAGSGASVAGLANPGDHIWPVWWGEKKKSREKGGKKRREGERKDRRERWKREEERGAAALWLCSEQAHSRESPLTFPK